MNEKPRHMCGDFLLAVYSHLAVTRKQAAANPKPTILGLINLFPETLGQRFSVSVSTHRSILPCLNG